MARGRSVVLPYTVCTHCLKAGKQSWMYLERIHLKPHCTLCGKAWDVQGPTDPTRLRPRGPKNRGKGQTGNGNAGGNQQNPNKVRNPPRASQAEEALLQVWAELPDVVQTAFKDAGYTPDFPPGLSTGQIGGDSSGHSQTAAAELYKQADEETKKLLKIAGVTEPEGPPPTPLQEVHQANKAYQKHTTDLRQLVLRRVTLQSKCEKAKAAYDDMCREVQSLSEAIANKETEVAKAHLLVKTKAAVPTPTPLLRVSDILKKAGVQLTEDQIQSIEEQLKEPATEAPQDEASKVGPRALGLVLADTEMEVEDVDALQKTLDEVRDRVKRKREASPPPAPNAGADQPAPPQHPPGIPGASGTQQAATGPVSGITQQSDDQERKDDERL